VGNEGVKKKVGKGRVRKKTKVRGNIKEQKIRKEHRMERVEGGSSSAGNLV
jgi:hypothetical protein